MIRITWEKSRARDPDRDITLSDSDTGGNPRIELAVDDEIINMPQPGGEEEEIKTGVLDDCEDLSGPLGGTWTDGNGATVATTTTKKRGTNAIAVKGGSTNYPYAEIEFDSEEDWSDWHQFSIWVAPINDDDTPALGETVRITLYDGDGDSVYYDQKLANTFANWYRRKDCELNDSGEGDEPTGESGTFDSSKVKKIRVTGQYTDDNEDFAFDQIAYIYAKSKEMQPIVQSFYRRVCTITVNAQVFDDDGSTDKWVRAWQLLESGMLCRQATLYVYPDGQSPTPSNGFGYHGCFRGEVTSLRIVKTENEQKWDVVLVFAVGKDPSIPDEAVDASEEPS